ncbi:MAG: 16S rRNA (guanine(527)-N(7))-methyltransferase RsmG [Clostridiales Family XIII bacterium]|jgi:16S rRNA (guanine527-N7)-methyltransferase|nr:16S rRNA (guanine(527)-N(7))-methyltransferase RsmG [Clostridiales Family XIII bacterium]
MRDEAGGVGMRDESGGLERGLASLGVAEAAKAAAAMTAFMDAVLERNEIINLTSITDRAEFEIKHLLDSLTCYGWPEIEAAKRIVDVGTGAGFPGVPLAIVCPEKRFLLMDALGKRIEFLKDAVSALNLTNVELLHSRAEDAGRDARLRERFDLCVCRAVGKLPVLAEYCFPLVKPGGSIYAYKTLNAAAETEAGLSAIRLLGGAAEADTRRTGTDERSSVSGHSIVVLKKIRRTPNTYPRRAGTPGKVPL